jgi:hypothetical protein
MDTKDLHAGCYACVGNPLIHWTISSAPEDSISGIAWLLHGVLLKAKCLAQNTEKRGVSWHFPPALRTYWVKHPFLLFRIPITGTGELAAWLRVLAALTEGPHSTPSVYTAAHDLSNFSSRDSNALFWPLQESGTCVVHIYMHVKHSYT